MYLLIKFKIVRQPLAVGGGAVGVGRTCESVRRGLHHTQYASLVLIISLVSCIVTASYKE